MKELKFNIPGQEKFGKSLESLFIWVEELSELQKAITKYARVLISDDMVSKLSGKNPLKDILGHFDEYTDLLKKREDVKEELADVLIVCMQIMSHFKFSLDEVQEEIDAKVKRNDLRYVANKKPKLAYKGKDKGDDIKKKIPPIKVKTAELDSTDKLAELIDSIFSDDSDNEDGNEDFKRAEEFARLIDHFLGDDEDDEEGLK